MAYIKDPSTGKYVRTDSAPAIKPTAPINIATPSSAGSGMKYGKDASGKYTMMPIDSSTPAAKQKVTTVAGLQDYAAQQGIDVSGTQPKESVLQQLLHVLNTGAYAVGGLISGKGIGEGIKQHTLPSEALGIKNPVGGFIADVLLDPTTYITFGYGAEAKLATKAGEVALSKAGTTLLKDSILKLGEEAGRKAVAEKVIQDGAEKFLAKDGLKFMGQQILPRSVVTAPFRAANTIVEKTPVVGKLYQGAKDLAGKAFVPFKSIKELPGGIGQEYIDKFSAFTKGTRDQVSKAVQEASTLGKTATKEIGKDAGVTVGKLLETVGVHSEPQAVVDAGIKNSVKINLKNPVSTAEQLGFNSFAKDMGGSETATEHARQFWSKKSQPGVFYHLTTGEPFNAFDKAKAGTRYAERGGGISEIRGLYLGGDKNAIKNFYGLDEEAVNLLRFDGQPKLMDLMNKSDEEKFLNEVQTKYGIKKTKSKEFGDALEKELQVRGYDGARYFDPYATGEEIVLVNPASVQSTTVNAKKVLTPAIESATKIPEAVQSSGNSVIDNIMSNIRGQHKDFATIEKEKGILDTELPDYVRHYLTPEGRDFLNKTGMNITAELNKPLRVKNPFAKTRQLDGTIEGINKYFQGRYGVQLFEPDAFKAFAARKAEHIKAVNTYDFITNIGQQFGKQAEVITKEIKNPITGKLTTKDVVKPVFENGIRYIESSVPQLKGTLLPEQIVKHVDDTYKTLSNEEATKKFLGLYDKVLGFWKGSVTGWFPSFHARNTMGGVFNNWIAGVKSPARYLQADQIARGVEGTITTQLGTKYSYSQIRELASKLGAIGQPGYLDVMREVEKDIGKGPVSKLMDLPKNAMEVVENRLRLPLFVDRLIKGDAPEQAAKQVFQFQFDYAPEALTGFEKNVMKRLLPFYRWTRGNIPLQLEQMAKQPGKYAAIGKLLGNLQSDKQKAKDEFAALPPYMREGLPVRLGEKNGFSQYLYGLGLPVEDINRLWKGDAKRTVASMVGELSPILKYPIEVGTGQNLFTGEPIEQNNRVYPFVNSIPGLRDWLEVTEHKNKDGSVSYRGNAYKLHFLNTALGRFYTTAGKLTDNNSSDAVKFLYGVLGAKAKSVDIEKEKFYRQQELQNRLEQQLESRGLINKFQRAYIPK